MVQFRFALFILLTVSFPAVPYSQVNAPEGNREALVNGSRANGSEQAICERIFSLAEAEHLSMLPVGELVARLGKEFLGTPYEAHTLEQPGEERLVTYLRGFDCVTFVENVLALSQCVKRQALTFEAYAEELQNIRYREKIIAGYPSRLHYFSEWIDENQRKGILQNVTAELGGESFKKPLYWMTRHRGAYRQMQDAGVFRSIAEIEEKLSNRELWYIPKTKISTIESGIRSGDVIAMVSRRDGLDVDHVGIAVSSKDGSLYYMHAPNEKGKVKISDRTLVTYVTRHRPYSGIMVARPTLSFEQARPDEPR